MQEIIKKTCTKYYGRNFHSKKSAYQRIPISEALFSPTQMRLAGHSTPRAIPLFRKPNMKETGESKVTTDMDKLAIKIVRNRGRTTEIRKLGEHDKAQMRLCLRKLKVVTRINPEAL